MWKIGNPFAYYGLADLFIVALASGISAVAGSLHPVTRWGGLIMILSQPLRLVLSTTPRVAGVCRLAHGAGSLKFAPPRWWTEPARL